MLNNIRNRKEGFTIIEVLIVLAIAGLILLIVFLAVPALQRNSRNTQIKDAAAAILGGVSEFQNNNGGANPTSATLSGTTLTLSDGSSSAEVKVQGGYTVVMSSSMPGATETGKLAINIGHKCNGNNFASASVPRAVSVGFLVETGTSGTQTQCVES